LDFRRCHRVTPASPAIPSAPGVGDRSPPFRQPIRGLPSQHPEHVPRRAAAGRADPFYWGELVKRAGHSAETFLESINVVRAIWTGSSPS
jgi:hypothetical protein